MTDEENKVFSSEEEEREFYINKLRRLSKLPKKEVESWMKEDPEEGDE